MNAVLQLQEDEEALFEYGSLILLESMERTLGRSYGLRRYPCHLRGWRRTWDSIYPNTNYYCLRSPDDRFYPKNILYLNIRRALSMLNGVVYVIRKSDLRAFDERENIYDRVDVARDLAGLEVHGGPVWAYVGKQPFVMTIALSVDDAAVRATYLQIVDKGLDEFGPEFRRQYEDSTDPVPISNVIDDRRSAEP